ncbi:heat shock transcription factor, X-linked member 3-like [Thomomys bottae]
MDCQGPTRDCEAKPAAAVDKEPAGEVPLNPPPDLKVDSGEWMDQQEDQVMISHPAFQENGKPEDQSHSAPGKGVNSHPRVVVLRNLEVTAENDVLRSVSWNDADDIRTIKETLYKRAILRKGTEKISFPHFDHIGK